MNNPCEECKYGPEPCKWAKSGLKSIAQACGPYAQYLGYQEGLAECEARIHQREQEIVEWVQREFDGWQDWDDALRAKSHTEHALAHLCHEWLKGEGRG